MSERDCELLAELKKGRVGGFFDWCELAKQS